MDYPNYTFGNKTYNLLQFKKVTWKGRKSLESMLAASKWTIEFRDGNKVTVDRQEYCDNNDEFEFYMLEITFPG